MSNHSTGLKLQSLPKNWIYMILILMTSIPLFFEIPMPNEPLEASKDFYAALMRVPEGKTILIASDWTGSTRGESKAQLKSILRILMRRNVKFAIYSTADPQAPQAAYDTVAEVSKERKDKGERPYERFTDWVALGYFPDAEAALQGFANDIRGTCKQKKDLPPSGSPKQVFTSPVLADIRKVQDFPLALTVTASKTTDFTVERLFKKVPLAFAVTGVMVPEASIYYATGQVEGLCGGLKGAFDLESLMEKGVGNVGGYKNAKIDGDYPGFPGMENKGGGTRYYPTLHFAVLLMIIMVVLGNVGMFMSKGKAKV